MSKQKQTEEADKPLLFAEDFQDEERFDPDFWDGRTTDPSWIPGYSEIVQANDINEADDLDFANAMRDGGNPRIKTKEDAFQMIGAEPQELPVEFAWLPYSDPGGGGLSADAARQLDMYINRKGYRLATKKDLERWGYGTTRVMSEAEDGAIRRGPDVALYVRSGEVARKWKNHKRRKAAEADGKPLPDEISEPGGMKTGTFETEERSREKIAH